MDRKQFITTAALATAATAIPGKIFAGNQNKKIVPIKPPKLSRCDTIALISPAGFVEEDDFQEALLNVECLGFNSVAAPNVLKRVGYLAGTDRERADDVNWAFGNPDVDGIVCTRGGWGINRMLDLLDYDLIRKNPKVLTGYSDVTSLLYGIYSRTGVVCFHGPVGTSTYNEYSKQMFYNVLTNTDAPLELVSADESENAGNPDYERVTIREGIATGELVGGNLSLVASLVGTKYDIDLTGKILFLEEVREEPYRIDRMLTQMLMGTNISKCAGIAMGVFSRCNARGDESGITGSFTLQEVLRDRLSPLNIPVVYGLSFGHVKNKMVLPFGIKAELNAGEKSLKLLEAAVTD